MIGWTVWLVFGLIIAYVSAYGETQIGRERAINILIVYITISLIFGFGNLLLDGSFTATYYD